MDKARVRNAAMAVHEAHNGETALSYAESIARDMLIVRDADDEWQAKHGKPGAMASPAEPTKKMLNAGLVALSEHQLADGMTRALACWKAMHAAWERESSDD